MDWMIWAPAVGLGLIAAGLYFAWRRHRREESQDLLTERARWQINVAPEPPGADWSGWLPIRLERSAEGARPVVVEIRAKQRRGAELAPYRARDAGVVRKVSDLTVAPDLSRAGRQLMRSALDAPDPRAGGAPHRLYYEVAKIGFAAKLPRWRWWRSTARLELELTVEETSGKREIFKFALRSEMLPLR